MTEHAAGDQILGRYTIERVLGKGGFGTTWAATDAQTGDRVAVKALDLSRVDDWKAVELFEREAQTLEGLSHPQIPRYLDFIPVEAAETGYLVQSLAPGESLDKVLARKGRFTAAELEGIAEHTLEILIYLESLHPQVVHRDIKPSNLLLDDQAQVYLVDFGAVQDAAKRTTEGGSTVAGTFGYMAPEQLHGAASPRSDLYALGMTLLHLSTGKHPSEMGRAGLKVDFEGEVNLPSEFVKFLHRLIEPNPDERWGSAREALDFLRHEVPVSPNLERLPDSGGSSIAEMVRAKEEAEARALQKAERDQIVAIEKRKVALTKRSDRMKVAMNDQELQVRVAPQRLLPGLAAAAISTFLFANPGFVVAGGFPFFGQYWPVFGDFWPARWAIWGAFVFLTAALWVWRATPPRHLRLSSDGYFTVYDRNEKKPVEAGRFENFSVTLYSAEPGWPAEEAEFTLSDSNGREVFSQRFVNLSQDDIDLVAELPTDWIPAEPEHQLDFESATPAEKPESRKKTADAKVDW